MKMSEEFALSAHTTEYLMYQNYINIYIKHMEHEDTENDHSYAIGEEMAIYENEEVIRYAFEKVKRFNCGCNFDQHFDVVSLNMMKLSVELSGKPCIGNLEKFCDNSFEVFKYVFDLYKVSDLEEMVDKYISLCDDEKRAYLMSKITNGT